MVVSTGLTKHVATVLGVPETSVASHVRNLREAGLISKTGRGITAAHMTSRDAAHVLVAASASVNVKDSVETVQAFGKLVSMYGRPRISLEPYASLEPNHTFIDAVVALLDAVGNGEFQSPSQFGFDVRLFGPSAKAEIEWVDQRSKVGSEIKYGLPNPPWQRQPPARDQAQSPDLLRQATFTEITLLQVGALIAGLL